MKKLSALCLLLLSSCSYLVENAPLEEKIAEDVVDDVVQAEVAPAAK